ncbi:MAG: phage tail tape measure protein [Luteimonas sp.]|nr:phage tail tape measure protein [Luteimonas sp.]
MATAATIDVLLRANTASYRAAMVDASRVATRQLGAIQREAEKTSRVMGQMRTAFVGVFSAQAARSGITALLDTAKAQQALVNSMQASVGSARGSAEAMAFVSQTSKELGLNFESAARGFQRLTASATATGIPMRDQQKLFLELSRAATSLQLAPDVVDRAMTALSQSFSKGRFQAEELRQQLAEAIPGVVPRFQKAVLEMTKGTELAGKSFDDLLQGGHLDVERFLPPMIQAFADLGKNWKDSAQSMQAESNRLGKTWRDLKLQLADGPFSDAAVAGMKAATMALENMGAILPILLPPMVSLAGLKLGKSTADWVKGLTASQKALEAQALVARAAAAEQVKRTALEAQFAIIEAEKARRTGGLILLEREVTIATAAHTAAVRNLDAAEKQVAATQSLTRRAGAATLGIFGGPVGLAATIGLTAASWLYFRSNTKEAQQALIEWNGTADQAITKFYELNKAQQAGAILQLEQQIEERRRQLAETLRTMAMAAGPSENIISEQDYRLAVQYADGMRQLEAQWAAGKLSADELSNRVDALNKRVISGSESSRYFASYLTEQGAALGTTSREAQALQGQLDTVTGKQHAASNAALAHANGLRTLSNAAGSMEWGKLDEWLSKQSEAAAARYSQAAGGDVGALREQFEQQLLAEQAFTKSTKAEVERRRASFESVASYLEAAKKLEEQKTKSTRALSAAENDTALSALRNAQARQQEYELEIAAGDSLSQSRRELLKFELLLRDTRDKSLKSRADEIRAVLQANVALEDQIDATRRLHEAKLRALAVDRQIADAQAAMQQRHARDLDAIRFGGNTSRWNEIANGISDQFQQQRLGLDRELQDRLATIPIEQMARRNEEEARYQQLLGKTVIAEAEAMAQSRKNFEELLEAQSNWINGFQRARDTYIAQAQDIASQTESIFTNVFDGLENTMVDFLHKGSADWKGFLDDINRQILQFIVRQQLSKWMQSMFGGDAWSQANGIGSAIQVGNSMMGGSSGSGFWSNLFGGLFGGRGGFKDGGYTGSGGRLQPAGVVHKGEVVWSQPDVARAGGVAVVEAMRRGLRGYDTGGFVGGSQHVALGRRADDEGQRYPGRRMMGSGGSGGFKQNVTFNVTGTVDSRSASQIARESGRKAQEALRRG